MHDEIDELFDSKFVLFLKIIGISISAFLVFWSIKALSYIEINTFKDFLITFPIFFQVGCSFVRLGSFVLNNDAAIHSIKLKMKKEAQNNE